MAGRANQNGPALKKRRVRNSHRAQDAYRLLQDHENKIGDWASAGKPALGPAGPQSAPMHPQALDEDHGFGLVQSLSKDEAAALGLTRSPNLI